METIPHAGMQKRNVTSMILKLSLDLPEDHEYVRTTRLLSRTMLDDLRVVGEDKDDIEIIVSELCTNVVRHAHSSEGRYQLVIEYHRDEAVITVEDQGSGFVPGSSAPPGTARPDDLTGGKKIGGFGVPLVNALSDRIKFEPTEPQGTWVQAVKALHYETREAKDRARKMDSVDGAEIQASME
jgi:serine/threonine-protein kinase RsbW